MVVLTRTSLVGMGSCPYGTPCPVSQCRATVSDANGLFVVEHFHPRGCISARGANGPLQANEAMVADVSARLSEEPIEGQPVIA